jgi:hypothetical protein
MTNIELLPITHFTDEDEQEALATDLYELANSKAVAAQLKDRSVPHALKDYAGSPDQAWEALYQASYDTESRQVLPILDVDEEDHDSYRLFGLAEIEAKAPIRKKRSLLQGGGFETVEDAGAKIFAMVDNRELSQTEFALSLGKAYRTARKRAFDAGHSTCYAVEPVNKNSRIGRKYLLEIQRAGFKGAGPGTYEYQIDKQTVVARSQLYIARQSLGRLTLTKQP